MWDGWKIRGEGGKGLGCSFQLTELHTFSLAAVSASQPSAAAAATAATINVAAIVVVAAAAAVRAKASQWTLFANSTLANALFVEQFRWGCKLGVGAGWWWWWGGGMELLGVFGKAVFGKAEGQGRQAAAASAATCRTGRPGQMQQVVAAVQVAAQTARYAEQQQHDAQKQG